MFHPRSCIPLALLALLPLVSSAQLSLPPPRIRSTLLDVLYADPDYVSLIKLLQRAKLVPTLNRLNGSTFFAPTNDAIARYPPWQQILEDEDSARDNIQHNLRQELFYHLLNYTISTLPTEQVPQEHQTLLFPHLSIEPPSHEPPPSPPWMPVPGGALGGDPQRLRIAYREDSVWAGVDVQGVGGVQVVKELVETANGVLLGVGNVITTPPDLSTVIIQHPSISYFAKVMTSEIASFLNSTSELTLFMPIDSAWAALPYYERLYLESTFATDDITRIVNMHAVTQKHVRWSDSFTTPANLTTIDGTQLSISFDNGNMNVSSSSVVQRDVYAANGVVHTVSSLLVPPGALQLTPEKYLLVLNCTSFVSMLHSVNLTELVSDTEAQYTILAPRDDVISLYGGESEFPPLGSEELKRTLQYHFIPGRWTPSQLRDGMLLETALEEPGLGGGKQVIGTEVSHEANKSKDQRTVRFGGAGVIGEAVEINNTLIYFVSRPLVPPADALQTALPSLELSTFLASIFSTNLAETLKTTPRTTLLMPPNSAFKRLGLLVSTHLLAATSKADLENVIQHHALKGVEYAASLQNGSQRTFATLEGSDIHVDRRTADGTIILSASGGWAGMQAELYTRDMLTQTGVIHELSDIMIPRSVELTVGKLVKAAKGSTMATMMAKAGFDWILNGTAPPENSTWGDLGRSGASWTLLCPTDDAFKHINLTALYADEERLQAIVSQHLIPMVAPLKPSTLDAFDMLNNNRPIVIDDSVAYTTLHSANSIYGDIVFRSLEGDDGTVVGVRGARGSNGQRDWAHIVSWGRATTGGGNGGVVQVDRLLVPYYPPWYIEYGAPIAVGVAGIALICAFFYGVRAIWRRDTTEATYEPIGGFEHEDSEDS